MIINKLKCPSRASVQTCKCKKGSDLLKRWVEAQHIILVVKCFVVVNNKIKRNKSYLLDGYISAVLFETISHCLCYLTLLVWLRKKYHVIWYFLKIFSSYVGCPLSGAKKW